MTREPSVDLSPSSWRQLDGICDQFERALRSGSQPLPEQFLQPVEPSLRKRLVRELILLEIEYRRVAGQNPTRAEYNARFPADPEAIHEAFQNSLNDAHFPGNAVNPAAETAEMDPVSGQASDPRSATAANTGDVATIGTGTDSNIGRVIGMYRLVERLGRGGQAHGDPV